MENEQTPIQQEKEEEVPKFRGLYRYVHISVKALDRIIIACVIVIILATFMGLQNRGFTVTFDSQGGTDVAPVKCNYGELIDDAGTPTREGYDFGGWYLDPQCTELWVLEADNVTGSMTLYARWNPKS